MSTSKHRSISQINKYTICPRQYRYQYIEGLRSAGSIHTAIGKAFDTCINQIIDGFDFEGNYFVPKVANEFPYNNSSELDDLIGESISTMLHSADEVLKDIPHSEEERGTVEETLFHLSHLVSPYFKEGLPSRNLIPLSAQHEISYFIEGIDNPVKGFVDMIAKQCHTGRIVIIDQKTGKGKKRGVSLEHSRQVWMYAKSLEKEFLLGYLPATEVHYFSKTLPALPREKKKDNHINGVVYDPDDLRDLSLQDFPEEIRQALYGPEVLKDKMDLLHTRYDHQEWLSLEEAFFDLEFSHSHNHWPKNRTHSLCSERFCDHWERCVGSESRDSLAEKRSRHKLRSLSQRTPENFVAEAIKPPPNLAVKAPPSVRSGSDFSDFLIN